MKMPPLDLLITVVVVWYVFRAAQKMKSRREPFTRTQKHILFGLGASIYVLVPAGLLIAGIIKRRPIVWIAFGLAAVISMVGLVAEYEQLYKDEGSA